MGSLPADIRRTGTLSLEDGKIIARQGNGQKVGEIVVGIDGVYFDGFEPIYCQRNDPPKLRLAARYDSGIGGGGCISFNRLRDDDRMEEMVMINCGSLDNPTDDRGQFRVLIRCSQDQQDWRVAYVATTHAIGKLWTGAAGWLGWLWKLNNVGDTPPDQIGRTSRMWSGDGLYMTQQQEDGNFVTYRLHEPFNESQAVAVWSAWTGKIEP